MIDITDNFGRFSMSQKEDIENKSLAVSASSVLFRASVF